MRATVFRLKGRLRLKIDLPSIDQSMISRAARHLWRPWPSRSASPDRLWVGSGQCTRLASERAIKENRSRVAEIGGIEDAPVELEPGALQRRCPGPEVFAAPAFDLPYGPQIEGAQIDEFRHVLVVQPAKPQIGAHGNVRAGVHTALIVDRFAAACS